MKKVIALKLSFLLLFSALSTLGPVATARAQEQSTCENGECIEGIIDRLQDLGSLYQKECLPSEGLKADLEEYHEENGLTERCWQLITEINHLESELEKHKTRLEGRLGCDSGDCKLPDQSTGLNFQLNALTKVEKNLSCTEPKKKEIRGKCPEDMNCVLASTALGMGGYIAEMMLPQNFKPKNCHLGNDSCMTQLATGFLKAAVNFFDGAWDLLKMAGRATKKKMGEFWDWVTGAEDHSSTSQLALAKASEDPGFFDMLLKDFPGTMKKIWQALVASIKEWLKNDIFCQKWQGVPHFSKCLQPTENFDCIPCKTMVNGLCAVSGTLVAEIVPAFLTGGLITAAKHGINGAAKISKLFKVSSKSIQAIKNSRVGKIAVSASQKVDDALRVSKGVRAAKVAVEAALKGIGRYLLSPTRKVLKQSFAALTKALKNGTAYVAKTKAGKVLIFGGKSAKLTGKIIIYPIENPMTTFAFKAGQRTFDKAFKLGAAKLVTKGAVAATMVKSDSAVSSALTHVEEARIVPKKTKSLLELEEELLKSVEPKRARLLEDILEENKVEFSEIIRNLYPELQYGDLARKLPPEKILAAEKELFLQISAMSDGPVKKALLKRYDSHILQGEARVRIVGNKSPTYKEILANSKLDDKKRLEAALTITNRKNISPAEKQKLAKTLQEAHLIGPDNGIFEYSWKEIKDKYDTLVRGGFTKDEADILIRSGLAGRPPVRELVKPGDTLFSGFAEDIVDGNFLKKRDELFELIKSANPEKKQGLFRRMIAGKSPSEAQKLIDNYESLYFIDYQHAIPELENILQGTKQVNKAALSQQYEKMAFNNFKDARKYLLDEMPELNKDTLLEVHKRMMTGGVENVKAADLGKIRNGHWYGNVPVSRPINDEIIKVIDENPYLTWVEQGRTANGSAYGQIQYPNSDFVRKEGLDLIRKNHPELVSEIERYQELQKLIRSPQGLKDDLLKEYDALAKNKLKMTENLVNAMTDDLMDWFTRQRTLIGDISSPEKLDEYVNLVSKFQRDLVSIHPLANGNGRSTREFALSYALMKEGLPPPRIIDPNADIYRSLDDWKKMVKHGVLASDFLVDDMIERVKFGLPLENSMDFATPYTRPPVQMALKGQKKVQHMDGVEYIDPRFYREILKREITSNPALKTELQSNPVEAWDKLHKRAEEVFAKNNIYYKHPKKGVERVALGYVDDDFKLLYGKPSFNNKELYDFKMKTWYSEDITWRGLASKHAEKSEGEIIQMFEELTSHNASNAVVGKVRGGNNPEAIRKAALEDFEKYNNDVFGDGLVKMAKDHSETGPMYGISYGYSTSKNREVGKAFAMGAMVVGEYGAHKAPELQALLKSRVLVGARRAHKDVDLGRLKQLREEFSYKYGRQQEVMGIGASDPDAITIVQTIDAEGEVMLSYLRNKSNPKEVLVIKGEIEPDAVPTPDQIVKRITLGQ
ncbi:MAG: hypothetical protein ACLGHN_07765 [Bacteriovoracia bacterium]